MYEQAVAIDMSLAGKHSRLFAAGLTRYTLSQIESALADADRVLSECRQARQDCIDILNADTGYVWGRNYPLTRNYIETDKARAAYDLLDGDNCPNFPHNGSAIDHLRSGCSGRECFPLSAWEKTVKTWRRWVAKVRVVANK